MVNDPQKIRPVLGLWKLKMACVIKSWEPSFNQHGTFNKKNYTDCKEWETQVYGQFVEIMDKVVGLIS